MQEKSYTLPRLYVSPDLRAGESVALGAEQSHYLGSVLRRKAGDGLVLFNGRDGEWLARVEELGRKSGSARCEEQRRGQNACPDVWLVFAPVKRDGTELVVEKATELGVAALLPVLTQRTVVGRVNAERLRKIALEAAEQSERLDLPDVREAQSLAGLLATWPAGRTLYVCAEAGEAKPLAQALRRGEGPAAILVGPEGGFTPAEFDRLAACAAVVKVSLGPRVLRAETAAIAALACWQALAGDGEAGRL